jgi:hypothetical protein
MQARMTNPAMVLPDADGQPAPDVRAQTLAWAAGARAIRLTPR